MKRKQRVVCDPRAVAELEDSTYVALANWEDDIREKMDELIETLGSVNPASDLYKDFVAKLLGRIDPKKPYGTALYNAIARLSWNMFFEAVVIRKRGKQLEVYLRKRADGDTAYPGEWHAPGSVFRPGENERDVTNRLEKEFGVPVVLFQMIGEYVDWEKGEARGSGVSRVYLIKLDGAPREDERHGWFPINELPKVTVDSHRLAIIPLAVKAHKARRTR